MIHNMTRLTTREEYPHGAEGVSKDKLTGRYCRGTFEATACVEKLAEYENAEEDGFHVKLENSSMLSEKAGMDTMLTKRNSAMP